MSLITLHYCTTVGCFWLDCCRHVEKQVWLINPQEFYSVMDVEYRFNQALKIEYQIGT